MSRLRCTDGASGWTACTGARRSAALGELERQMPGATAPMEPDAPGMHTTDSIDYVVVVSGEATTA